MTVRLKSSQLRSLLLARVAFGLFVTFVLAARAAMAAPVTVSGSDLMLDGSSFRFVGANCYYLMEKAKQGEFAAVDEVLDEAQAMGLKAVRTWAFYDGPGGFQTAPGVYDDTYLAGLDYVVKAAADRHLKLILPLTNYWADYGGMPQNVAWDLGISVAEAETKRNEFYYDTSGSWTRFQSTVSHILNRTNSLTGVAYKDDDTIMAWELANEPRASKNYLYQSAAQDRAAYVNWIDQMSAYLKSLDPDTLVSLGTEGLDPDYDYVAPDNFGWEQTDFVDDQGGSDIDFAVAHNWPEHWAYSGMTTQAQFMQMVADQAADAQNVLGMPYVLEEFGYSRVGGVTTTRDDWFNAYFETAYDHGASGAMFWILYDDNYPDNDGFGVYYPGDASTRDIIEYWARRYSGESVPEPATIFFFASGLAAVAAYRRRKKAR